MMEFAKGNKMIEKLEEKYQEQGKVFETKYNVVSPVKRDSDLEVIDAEKLKVGDGKYLNAYHQVKDNGNLTKKQQAILEDNVYNPDLKKDDMKLRVRTQIDNKKRHHQKKEMEMM